MSLVMKPLVIKKHFGSRDEYFFTREHGDEDEYILSYYDPVLDITLGLKAGGDTDGGSVPEILTPIFDELLDPTAHGFGFHDELWRHRVMLKDEFEKHGITFTQTNRVMRDIHKEAKCTWYETHCTRLGVRWGGYWKWTHPCEKVRNAKNQTLFILKGNHTKQGDVK